MSSSDDRCAHHPRAAAVVTCMSCDLRVCRDCIDVKSGADSCRPCVAARPLVEQLPPRGSEAAEQQRPTAWPETPWEELPTSRSETAVVEQDPTGNRSGTAVILGWFGLLVGGLSALTPMIPVMPFPFVLLSPVVMLVLGISVLVMSARDLEDIREGRLPPDFKSQARHAQVLGVLNLLAVLLCGALAGVFLWFFSKWWSH